VYAIAIYHCHDVCSGEFPPKPRGLDISRYFVYTITMKATLERIRTEAKALSTDDREVLLAVLDFDLRHDTPQPENVETEAAWDAEIDRRVDEMKAGSAKLLTSEEFFSVFSEARAMFKTQAASH
jgi:putative addiction module component (TIGR02574 family)